MAVKKFKVRPLTPKQLDTLNYIKKFSQRHGYSPSLEELANKFDVSIPTIHEQIQSIRKKGRLQKDDFYPRSLKPLVEEEKTVQIPVLGKISAGTPIHAFEEPKPIFVPTTLIRNPENYYALKVEGDSMIDDDVWDGDTILVKYQTTADVGEMVVAVVDDEVTLKRYGGVEKDKVTLIPRNPHLDPYRVDADRFEIRGKFAGLLRRGQNLNSENKAKTKSIR